jgi:DNA-binding response OmpR family regulator
VIVVDIDAREVRVDGSPVELRPKEFEVFAALAGSPRRVFTRGELMGVVWGVDAASEAMLGTVTEHVRRLRGKLGYDAVRTVRNAGYRIGPAGAKFVGGHRVPVAVPDPSDELAEKIARRVVALLRPAVAP